MKKAKIYYARMDEFYRKEEKYIQLQKFEHIGNVDWQVIKPNKKYIWLTNGLEDEFDNFIPIGNKETKTKKGEAIDCIFQIFSTGVHSSRDAWVYNFDFNQLSINIQQTIDDYNEQVIKWKQKNNQSVKIDDFIIYDDAQISWSSTLKKHLNRGTLNKYDPEKIRDSLYRPFCNQFVYFDEILNDRRGQFSLIFPTPETEAENRIICLPGIGNRQAFGSFISRFMISMDFAFEKAQCFPFYTYDEDGTNRRENITDWALKQFRTHYQDETITKWDIFHYTYAVLHHPQYRDRYAANLKRELPRIPFTPEFCPFVEAGKRLTEIHIHYEKQPEYRLKHLENKDLPIDWRVEKMRLSKDKTQLKYNDFLTLTNIPLEVFEYRLGNRSALEWVIDQYQVSIDQRSGITNNGVALRMIRTDSMMNNISYG